VRGSSPQTYTIAEVLKWNDDREIELNPKFQRGPVWAPPARSYLIDSLLHGYPIPKLLFRTKVDRTSRRTVRDVVDGQQRLRTIIDFAADKFALGVKASEQYRGLRYSDLDEDTQDALLAYKLTCEQLINANDEDVLEIFIRINSYTVPVNEPELRNARYDNAFSSFVKGLIRQVPLVWQVGVISDRDRVRMVDQSVLAEVVGFFQTGVVEGGESGINRIYAANVKTDRIPDEGLVISVLHEAANLLDDELSGEALAARPHFLMLVAAVMYARRCLPAGRLSFEHAPDPADMLTDRESVLAALVELNTALESDVGELSAPMVEFAEARTSTQRMKSRQVRFDYFCWALAGKTSIG